MEQYNGDRDLNNLIEFVTMMKAKAATGPAVLVPPGDVSTINVEEVSKEQRDIEVRLSRFKQSYFIQHGCPLGLCIGPILFPLCLTNQQYCF